MRFLGTALRFIYSLYAFATFLLLMLPVFVWALLVLPLGTLRAGNLIYKACTLWADIWFVLIFIRVTNHYEGANRNSLSYIYLSNHISYFDIPLIVKCFRTPVRPLAKSEIGKVPLFGIIYKSVVVSVDRSSAANRARSVQQLKNFLEKGVSVLVFPEGTFNETPHPMKEVYDGAFRIAIETGTPIKPVLMLDTYDRLHYSSIFSLNPGKCRIVYLEDVPVTGLTQDDLPELKARVVGLMEAGLRRYGASWIKD